MMQWWYLAAAISLEVAGTTSMKLSDGFTRWLPSALIFVFYALAFIALTYALKKIEVSVAYAIWSGVGTALIAVIGIFWFGESVGMIKVISLLLIIAGVVGLNMSIAH